MPTINRPKKKRENIGKRKERADIYNTSRWKRLRTVIIMQQPLCFICAAQGKVKGIDEVHHTDSFLNYEGQMRIQKAYDPNNCVGLCKHHHDESHTGKFKGCLSKEEYIERLKRLNEYNPIEGFEQMFNIDNLD